MGVGDGGNSAPTHLARPSPHEDGARLGDEAEALELRLEGLFVSCQALHGRRRLRPALPHVVGAVA